jgi:hypothetical protein
VKNWKTSAFALIAATAGFVAMHPMYTAHWPLVGDIASYIMIGGLAGIGLAAKDSSTHSNAAEVYDASPIGMRVEPPGPVTPSGKKPLEAPKE